MHFTDTHSHIYLPEFEEDRATVVQRAFDAGVTHMILPNIDLSSIPQMKNLTSQYPDNFRMAMGLHPSEVYENYAEVLNGITSELCDVSASYVAVGEIGIDLYWDKTYEKQQMIVFEQQVILAERLNLPIIIHCRDGLDQVLEVLQRYPSVNGVFHCFGGTDSDVERIRNVGDYYFGIGGVVTFKKSKLPEVLPTIGIDRILIETDAPYLAPTPHRGKRNESSYVICTAAHIAQTLNTTVAEIANITSKNSADLFGF
jgi:TatD DNase family protein